MINWPIVPMVYNDSFTYMEWLGKLSYIAENHEGRIDDCEKNIVDLWTKVNNHESRIGELEDWRTNTVDPFIEETRDTLADHEQRIRQNTNDIAALYNWKINTVDPFVEEIGGWKTNTVDPFITSTTTWKNDVVDPHITSINSWKTNTVDPFIESTTDELIRLGANATAEASARRNADNELSDRITSVTTVANDTKAKVNRLEIQMQNVGTVRYFMDTAIVSPGYGSNTNMKVTLPDNDWVTCDVRFLINDSGAYDQTEYRITGKITDDDLGVIVNGKQIFFNYNSTTRELTITVANTTIAAADVTRFDYILYTGALTQAAQDQADIDFYNAMDANGDGKVDARDASLVLSFYADASTGVIPGELSGKEAWAWWATNVANCNPDAYPDFGGDGKVNAIDASALLGYYAYAATTHIDGITGPELMKMYRTESEQNS